MSNVAFWTSFVAAQYAHTRVHFPIAQEHLVGIDPLDIIPSDGPGNFSMNSTVIKDAGGAGRDAFLTVFDHAIANFSIGIPEGGCAALNSTSGTARQDLCVFAVSSNFFQ